MKLLSPSRSCTLADPHERDVRPNSAPRLGGADIRLLNKFDADVADVATEQLHNAQIVLVFGETLRKLSPMHVELSCDSFSGNFRRFLRLLPSGRLGMRISGNVARGHARQAVAKPARPDNASLLRLSFILHTDGGIYLKSLGILSPKNRRSIRYLGLASLTKICFSTA